MSGNREEMVALLLTAEITASTLYITCRFGKVLYAVDMLESVHLSVESGCGIWECGAERKGDYYPTLNPPTKAKHFSSNTQRTIQSSYDLLTHITKCAPKQGLVQP